VARASRGWIGASLLVAALIGAVWLWRAVTAQAPAPPAIDAGARGATSRASAPAGSATPASGRAHAPPPPWRGPAAPPAIVATRAAPMRVAQVQHLIDPCTELVEPAVPPGFEVYAAQGITIAGSPAAPAAGPSDVPLRPLALAHLVAGLLEEAAQLTGTPRRAELTVIIYSSRDDFHGSGKAPAWAGGLYDGAVRLPPEPRADLGVAMSTLRHEVMHAQLHAAVGCMPVWFNEGAAMYFAGTAPVHDWLEMLRAPAPLELALLEAPALDEHATARVDRVYAQSLAMMMLAAERFGGPGLQPAVLAMSDANRASPRDGHALWSRLHPAIDHAAVRDSLSRRIFGVPPGELGATLDGPLCCHGLQRATELACRAAAPRPGRAAWTDDTTSPRASCRARW
jgi:hypothetical protein